MSVGIALEDALRVVESFDPAGDDLAVKSQDLMGYLLRLSPAPFSRHQFTPGHVTCTALVRHPSREAVLFMHHHRLQRWLLPGGHVEADDADLASVAAREALEETHVRLLPDAALGNAAPVLAGIDVHAIPPKGVEPLHLHHDLIWSFRAASETIAVTGEAPSVQWATEADWERLGVAENIRRSILRTRPRGARA